MFLDRFYQFEYKNFLLGVPVVLYWLNLPELNTGAIFISALIFSLAELFRFLLVAERKEADNKVKSIFLFGSVHQNEIAKFFHQLPRAERNQIKYKAIYSSLFFFFVNFVMRMNPTFQSIDSATKYLFIITICFWINCKDLESLGKVLFFHFAIGLIVFLNFTNYSSTGFLAWLMISLLNFNFLRRLPNTINAQKELSNYQRLFKLAYLKFYFTIAAFGILTYFSFQSIVPGYTAASQSQKTPVMTENIEQRTSMKIPKPILKELTKRSLDAVEKEINQSQGPVDISKLDLSAAQKDYKKLLEVKKMLDENKILSKAQLDKLDHTINQGPDFDDNNPDGTVPLGRDGQKSLNNFNQIQKLSKSLKDISEQIEKKQNEEPSAENKFADKVDHVPSEKHKIRSPIEEKNNQLQNKQFSLQETLKRSVESEMKLVEHRQEKVIQKHFDERLFKFKNYGLVIGIAFIMVILFFLRLGHQRKPGPHQLPNLSRKTRSLIKELYLLIRSGTLPPAQEVIKSYYLIEMVFKEVDLGRQEELPPLKYGQKIVIAFPIFSQTVTWPIQLFCHVFYGEKTPAPDELASLRKDLLSLLKILKII